MQNNQNQIENCVECGEEVFTGSMNLCDNCQHSMSGMHEFPIIDEFTIYEDMAAAI